MSDTTCLSDESIDPENDGLENKSTNLREIRQGTERPGFFLQRTKVLEMIDTPTLPTTRSAPLVLFVTYGNGHIAKVAPVLKALESIGIRCAVMALTLGYRQAKSLGLAPVRYADFLHLTDVNRIMSYGRMLLPGNSHPDVDELETLSYLGINYAEWVDSFGEEDAAQRYASQGRRGFLPINFMGRVIDHFDPVVVVSTSSPRSEQAAIEAASARSIPTLTMLDLLGMPPDYYPAGTVFADRMTVVSSLAKKNMLACGVDASKIVVTGCPAYDPLFESSNVFAGLKFRSERGWTGLDVVLWAGILEEPAPNVLPEYLDVGLGLLVEQRLRDWVNQRPNTALIVRYHPTQYHLFKHLGEHPRVYVSDPRADTLQPLLHACDCVVTQMSTVGYEGALIGKRLLALSFSPMTINYAFDYGKIGVGESVLSLDELVPMLEQPPLQPVNRDAFPPAGAATPRVVEQILKLTQHPSEYFCQC